MAQYRASHALEKSSRNLVIAVFPPTWPNIMQTKLWRSSTRSNIMQTMPLSNHFVWRPCNYVHIGVAQYRASHALEKLDKVDKKTVPLPISSVVLSCEPRAREISPLCNLSVACLGESHRGGVLH